MEKRVLLVLKCVPQLIYRTIQKFPEEIIECRHVIYGKKEEETLSEEKIISLLFSDVRRVS